MKKNILAAALSAVLVLTLGTGAFASGESWGEYSMVNDGYGYLTANFPAVYPAEQVIPEGTQAVSDKADAILLTMTDGEKAAMLAAFAREGVVWDGAARMGIPAVTEGEPVFAADVFTSFDAESIRQALEALALEGRAAGANAMRLVGLDWFPEPLALAAAGLFADVMNDSGVIALTEEASFSGEPSADTDARVKELLAAMGAAGYLQYMQVSRDGTAALDMTPPPSIVPARIEAPAQAGDELIRLPESAKAGESFEITATVPADVISAMLRDENGENLNVVDLLKENLGDAVRFTFTLECDAPVTMPIYLYTMGTDGWAEEPMAAAVLTVG